MQGLDVEYLTGKQLAEKLHIQPQTLRKWRWDGTGPQFTRIGGRWGRVLYAVTAVEKWLAEREHQSTAEETVAAAARNDSSYARHRGRPRPMEAPASRGLGPGCANGNMGSDASPTIPKSQKAQESDAGSTVGKWSPEGVDSS